MVAQVVAPSPCLKADGVRLNIFGRDPLQIGEGLEDGFLIGHRINPLALARLRRSSGDGASFLALATRSKPIPANIIGPRFSAASIRKCTAGRHFGLSSSAFGSFLMKLARVPKGALGPLGSGTSWSKGRSQDTTQFPTTELIFQAVGR
jgi:hypothetical protein